MKRSEPEELIHEEEAPAEEANEDEVADEEDEEEVVVDEKEASARLVRRGKVAPCPATLSCAHFTIRSRSTSLASALTTGAPTFEWVYIARHDTTRHTPHDTTHDDKRELTLFLALVDEEGGIDLARHLESVQPRPAADVSSVCARACVCGSECGGEEEEEEGKTHRCRASRREATGEVVLVTSNASRAMVRSSSPRKCG